LRFGEGLRPSFGLSPGRRPNRGQSPPSLGEHTARRSLAAHPAAKPERQDMSSPFDQIFITEGGEVLEESELSLLETLDHVLNRGLVITGEITISVADIDLVFIGLDVLLSSVETANEVVRHRQDNKANS